MIGARKTQEQRAEPQPAGEFDGHTLADFLALASLDETPPVLAARARVAGVEQQLTDRRRALVDARDALDEATDREAEALAEGPEAATGAAEARVGAEDRVKQIERTCEIATIALKRAREHVEGVRARVRDEARDRMRALLEDEARVLHRHAWRAGHANARCRDLGAAAHRLCGGRDGGFMTATAGASMGGQTVRGEYRSSPLPDIALGRDFDVRTTAVQQMARLPWWSRWTERELGIEFNRSVEDDEGVSD